MADFENMSRIADQASGDAVMGHVVYAPVKSLFLISMYAVTLCGAIFWFRLDAVLVFVAKTVAVLLLGHSVGMHRRLIHKSFDCPLWLERCLVYMGVLAGLGGPFAMIRTHDFRDWAQRQTKCHDYFAHRRPPLIDALWQMHGDIRLDRPPHLVIESEVANDSFYRFIDKHWIAVHLPWVIAFWLIGGPAWVIWGVCAQVATTVTGHWLIGYFAHQPHHDDWQVQGAGVQGRNVILVRSSRAGFPRNGSDGQSALPKTHKLDLSVLGILTMGESWHNNHHAFPGSARIGLYKGQSDPGYRFIKALEALGLAWNIRLAKNLAYRPQLQWPQGPQPHFQPDLKACPSLSWLRQQARRIRD